MAGSTAVADAPDRERYEITVDGHLAGFAQYRLRPALPAPASSVGLPSPGRITFVHTEIDDAYAGKGLAGALVRAALDDARARGLRVVPVCPYVKAWIERHPEYADLTRSV